MSIGEINTTFLNSLALSYLMRPSAIGRIEEHLIDAKETYPYRQDRLERIRQPLAFSRRDKHDIAKEAFTVVDNILGIIPPSHPSFFTAGDFAIACAKMPPHRIQDRPALLIEQTKGSEIAATFEFVINADKRRKHIHDQWIDYFNDKPRKAVYLPSSNSVVLCKTYSRVETLLIAAHEYVHALQHENKMNFEDKIITEGQAFSIQRRVADILMESDDYPLIWDTWYVNYEVRLLAAAYKMLTDISGSRPHPDLAKLLEETASIGSPNHFLGGTLFILAEEETDRDVFRSVFRNDFNFLDS